MAAGNARGIKLCTTTQFSANLLIVKAHPLALFAGIKFIQKQPVIWYSTLSQEKANTKTCLLQFNVHVCALLELFAFSKRFDAQ